MRLGTWSCHIRKPTGELYLAKRSKLVTIYSNLTDFEKVIEEKLTRKPTCKAQNVIDISRKWGHFKKGGLTQVPDLPHPINSQLSMPLEVY